jgi:eukaryotic-like serine/threonine-protein kinase
LKKRGYRVLITNTPDRAIERFENEIRIADCAIFSAQDLGARSVQAFNQLGQSDITRDIPAVLLVDQRQKELVQAAETNEHRLLLPLPLKIKSLLQTLAKLLRKSDA